MQKSLWSVQFKSNLQDFGGGVVVIDGNQVVGGDFGYYYLGTCTISGNSATAIVTVTKHNPSVSSIFGDIHSFKLVLTGTVSDNLLSFSGHMESAPQMTLTASMRKLVNLQ
ncbi:hypothetical protein SDC9_114436 [bioreactor metagenome]|uniref:T3SS negative regulator,GrlR n=1 Tax=bioreactor metagenome TaxID=1076179 RepID=A0A645BWK8_9ZZZZ